MSYTSRSFLKLRPRYFENEEIYVLYCASLKIDVPLHVLPFFILYTEKTGFLMSIYYEPDNHTYTILEEKATEVK